MHLPDRQQPAAPNRRARGPLGSLMLPLLILSAALGGGGCSSRPGEAFRPAFLQDDQGVIYVFRSPGTFNGSIVRVFINQEPVGTLRTGEYLACLVAPGEYFVRVEAVSSSAVRVGLTGGESAYVRVSAAAVRPTPIMEIVQESDGIVLISRTRLAPATPAENAPR